VFMGHGMGADKADVRLWEKAVGTLRALGMDVEWRMYDVGHWYKAPDELDDIVTF
jgi:predicted esterase